MFHAAVAWFGFSLFALVAAVIHALQVLVSVWQDLNLILPAWPLFSLDCLSKGCDVEGEVVNGQRIFFAQPLPQVLLQQSHRGVDLVESSARQSCSAKYEGGQSMRLTARINMWVVCVDVNLRMGWS